MSQRSGNYKPKGQAGPSGSAGGGRPVSQQQSRPASAAGAAAAAGPASEAPQRQYQGHGNRGGFGGRGGHAGGRGGFGQPAQEEQHKRAHLATVAVPTQSALVPAVPGSVRLVSNFMQVTTDPKVMFYQYAVEVEAKGQELNPRRRRFHIVQLMRKLLGSENVQWAYNGEGILFSREKLPQDKFNNTVHDTVSSITFVKTIAAADKAATEETAHALNLVLKLPFQESKLVKIGRDYFDVANADVLNERLKVAMGIDAAIHPVGDKPLLCADVIFKAINRQTPLGLIVDLKTKFKQGAALRDAMIRQFKGRIVVKDYGRRQNVIVDDVDMTKTPDSYTFDHQGKKMNVVQYFKQKYNLTIKDPKQPLLVHKRGTGKDAFMEYLVPELLTLTGIDTEQRQAMTDYTGMSATNRAKQIMHSLQTTNVAGVLQPWGFTVDQKFIEVNGKTQAPVRLQFAGATPTVAKDAKWAYYKDKPLRPKHLEKGKWAFVYPKHLFGKADQLWQTMQEAAPGLGIKIGGEPEWGEVDLPRGATLDQMYKSYVAVFDQVTKDKNLDIVLFMATDKDEAFYGALESYLYFNCGVAAQYVQDQSKRNMSVASNILRQMTYKIGAVPYVLPDLAKYVPKDSMLIGIDVHHSGEIGERRQQGSVVGFSATIDPAASEFFSSVTVQQPGKEIIESLSSLFGQAVEAYKKKNAGKAPSNVIVLRDGVGEGQLKQVKEKELTQLTSVLAAMKIQAKITVVVVLKRIRDRLFQQKPGSTTAAPNFANPGPGTVVDQAIVDGNEFIMIAHKPMREDVCVSPVRFKIIQDEVGMGKANIQQMVWQLAHGYFALDHTIKVPNLCHHAHKISFLHGMMDKGTRRFKREGGAAALAPAFTQRMYFV